MSVPKIFSNCLEFEKLSSHIFTVLVKSCASKKSFRLKTLVIARSGRAIFKITLEEGPFILSYSPSKTLHKNGCFCSQNCFNEFLRDFGYKKLKGVSIFFESRFIRFEGIFLSSARRSSKEVCQLASQPTKKPSKQLTKPTNQSNDQPIKETNNQPTDQSTNQLTKQLASPLTDKPTNRGTDKPNYP